MPKSSDIENYSIVICSGYLSSNSAVAQTLHNQTLYEMTKQTSGSNENAHIAVGSSPVSICVLENKITLTFTVYVAN
jgi:hypothetical protein